jgi:hypothetical protein
MIFTLLNIFLWKVTRLKNSCSGSEGGNKEIIIPQDLVIITSRNSTCDSCIISSLSAGVY